MSSVDAWCWIAILDRNHDFLSILREAYDAERDTTMKDAITRLIGVQVGIEAVYVPPNSSELGSVQAQVQSVWVGANQPRYPLDYGCAVSPTFLGNDGMANAEAYAKDPSQPFFVYKKYSRACVLLQINATV